MSESLLATDPQTSASVSASAGTGKTWLLVTRLIRLLLTGARPDGILAVTFTRKAAAEMLSRLNERLLEMAQCTDQELKDSLNYIGVKADKANLNNARVLYESLLSTPYAIRTSTFHSFCQDILRRFPIDAGIAPGFELLESTTDLKQAAWNAYCAQASNNPDGETARTIETLIDNCEGQNNTFSAIDSFIEHRSDWWAFTEEQTDPLGFAIETLTHQLNISHDENPCQEFFTTVVLDELSEFAALLDKHPIKQNIEALDALKIIGDKSAPITERFNKTVEVFFTKAGEPRKRKESQSQADKMGVDGQQRFLNIHDGLCESIRKTRGKINALDTFNRTSAWYQAGFEVLNHFQRLKSELRVLDFTDLEWKACQLLNHGNNVHWIQYKLDQRIDHLLIDEFQDTNPTQWQLILPILQELAAGENERQRSIFLVGDNKQSIYRFRRADPELFDTAQLWLKDNLNTRSQTLDISWRSAEAIVAFVNRVFGNGPLGSQFQHFTPHTTHYPDLWGKVEFLPLIEQEEKNDDPEEQEQPIQLREPLHTPATIKEDRRHYQEGKLITRRINELIDNQTLIGHNDAARPVDYGDILILVRNRTHVSSYEQALKEENIPYSSADRGTLLSSLEICDLVNLLEWLIAPFNNLALANVLRSPIFDCSYEDLITLARQKNGNWFERLSHFTSNSDGKDSACTDKLKRAHTLLFRWRKLAGKLPVHDLLDRIFNEADIINRYRSASPQHLQHSVTANLTRFIELALEIDSGRNPTVGRFVTRLQSLRIQSKEAPDEGQPIESESRVRIMTIHAAKGLEAPVVFLADSAFKSSDRTAYQALVNWPSSQKKPDCFLLTGKKDTRDTVTDKIIQRHAIAESGEDANLLYVAITRARQYLFISGCQSGNNHKTGWYGKMLTQCIDGKNSDLPVFESGQYPKFSKNDVKPERQLPEIDPLLGKPLPSAEEELLIAPSYLTGTLNQPSRQGDGHEMMREEARDRGIAVHRCLQLICEKQSQNDNSSTLINQLNGELGINHDNAELASYINEALDTFNHPDFSHLFDSSQFLSAYNELPIHYFSNGKMVYGIIDRLVVTRSEIWVIDYKTHRITEKNNINALVEHYHPQVSLYCKGIKKIWTDKKIRGFLLFTHKLQLVEIDNL